MRRSFRKFAQDIEERKRVLAKYLDIDVADIELVDKGELMSEAGSLKEDFYDNKYFCENEVVFRVPGGKWYRVLTDEESDEIVECIVNKIYNSDIYYKILGEEVIKHCIRKAKLKDYYLDEVYADYASELIEKGDWDKIAGLDIYYSEDILEKDEEYYFPYIIERMFDGNFDDKEMYEKFSKFKDDFKKLDIDLEYFVEDGVFDWWEVVKELAYYAENGSRDEIAKTYELVNKLEEGMELLMGDTVWDAVDALVMEYVMQEIFKGGRFEDALDDYMKYHFEDDKYVLREKGIIDYDCLVEEVSHSYRVKYILAPATEKIDVNVNGFYIYRVK